MARFILIVSIIGIISFLLFGQKVLDYSHEVWYDLSHKNKPVISKAQIDAVLQPLELEHYKNLEDRYKNNTKSSEPKYKRLLSNSKYYKVHRAHLNQRIVGRFRVKDFVTKDKYYRKCLFNKKAYLYWLMDKKLLYSILALQDELRALGYDANAFSINSGHRHPKKNEDVKGAGSSKHIKGEAADLSIGDINKDGRYTDEDKAIVLKLVDKKIIGNKGGVGLYPGTRSVHIDVRGHRARWNSY